MRWSLVLAVVLAGCGSSWVFRETDVYQNPPPTDCARSVFYQDGDGDGWGDPDGETDELCQVDPERGFTAANGIDCDDADRLVTGRVGQICPSGLVDSGTVTYTAFVDADSEYAIVHSGSDVVFYTDAEAACVAWGGQEYVDEDGDDDPTNGTYSVRGRLATFDSSAQVSAALTAVLSSIAADDPPVYAGFLGIAWDSTNETWVWTDDSQDSVITADFDFCGDEDPTLADFFPNLNPDDPDHSAQFEQEKDRVRLALVIQDFGDGTPGGADICLGLPPDAIPEDLQDDIPDPFDQPDTGVIEPEVTGAVRYYQTTYAHFLCERTPVPDPEDYKQYAQDGEDAAETE